MMGGMGRWAPDAKGRLEKAAFELFVERGFEQATVTEIARRAGLTERTFYRHFADKPEVFFSPMDSLEEGILAGIAGAPDDAAPIEVVGAALETVAAEFEDHRRGAQKRREIIASDIGLQERELIKMARIATAMADALAKRGVENPAATLAAEMGVAIFRTAMSQWASDSNGSSTLRAMIRESLDSLKDVASGK